MLTIQFPKKFYSEDTSAVWFKQSKQDLEMFEVVRIESKLQLSGFRY